MSGMHRKRIANDGLQELSGSHLTFVNGGSSHEERFHPEDP